MSNTKFKPGDIIQSKDTDGLFSLKKILRVETLNNKEQTTIYHLLRYDKCETIPEDTSKLRVYIWHMPIMAQSVDRDCELVKESIVADEELKGYASYLQETNFPEYIKLKGLNFEEEIKRAVEIFNEASALLTDKKASEAIRKTNEALAIYPGYFEALNLQAAAYIELNDYQTALQLAKQSSQKSEDNYVAHLLICRCLYSQNKYEDLRNCARYAQSKWPKKEFADYLNYAYSAIDQIDSMSEYLKLLDPKFGTILEDVANELTTFILERSIVDDKASAKDFISASSTIVAERCIEIANEFKLREHSFEPGQRIFSEKINHIIAACSGYDYIRDLGAWSIFRILKFRLLRCQVSVSDSDFPTLTYVLRHFAATIGKAEDWGRAPLSIKALQPYESPLQFAYETRNEVDRIFLPFEGNLHLMMSAAIYSLADMISFSQDSLSTPAALLLAFETINAMAKTAPMTEAALKNMSFEEWSVKCNHGDVRALST